MGLTLTVILFVIITPAVFFGFAALSVFLRPQLYCLCWHSKNSHFVRKWRELETNRVCNTCNCTDFKSASSRWHAVKAFFS